MAYPQSIPFHGQTIPVFTQNHRHYVAMKPICENIGLDWDAQRKRIMRNSIMAQGTVMMTAPSNGGKQETLCLPLEYLNGWLFGVDARRVKPQIRERLLQYQRECFQVLAAHFMQPKQPPAVALPAGFGRNGLPLGLQVVGPYRNDVRTLRVAKWIEATLAFQIGLPKLVS